jgi:hypothetical protein
MTRFRSEFGSSSLPSDSKRMRILSRPPASSKHPLIEPVAE